MIGFITGTVEDKTDGNVLLSCGGIGYEIFVSEKTSLKIIKGEKIKLFTKLIVKEDDISLAGFYSRKEREMFELLLKVTKVGTKMAFAVLSMYDIDEVKLAILKKDVSKLSKVSGIGRKTAERIILELSDKISSYEIDFSEIGESDTVLDEDALEALTGLGFSLAEAKDAIQKIKAENLNLDTSTLISRAISLLGRI